MGRKKLLPSKRRIKGVIRFWDNVRGYGFVAVEGYKDIFMPASSLPNLRKAPVSGQRVHFNVGVGKDGKNQAENVVVKVTKMTFKVLRLVIILFFGCANLTAQVRPVGIVAASDGATISGQRVLANQVVFVGDKIDVKVGGLVILKLSGKPLILGEGSHTVGKLKVEETKPHNPVAVSHVGAHVNQHACENAASPSVPSVACAE